MNTKFTTLLLLFTLWVGGLFAQPKYSTYLDGTKTVTGLLTGGAKETNHGMTVEFWFNADEVDTKQLIYYPGDTNGGHLKDGVNFWIEGGYICMGIYYYGNKDIGNKSFEGAWFREEIQKSTWYHVALVLNSEADKMFWYLNGTYKNELDVKFAKQLFGKKFTEKLTVLPTEWSENSSYIFSKNSIPGDKIETVNSDLGGISFFKGYIGLFRKWNSARTISQINDNKLEFIKKDTYTEPEYFVSYLRTTFVWDGNEDSTWENGNNWLGGSVPQAGSNVYIEVENTERTNNAVKPITGNETFNFNLFTVSPKSTLRLSNTAILNVTGVFTIKSDATGTGSLITNGGVVNAGTFNIERHIAYTGMGTFSSPVVDANMGMFLNKTYKVYKHQEYLRQYGSPYSLVTGTSEVINKVEGYFVDYNSLISDSKITYTGVPTTGNTSFILSSTKYNEENNMHYGWNLIGNPYPSAIDLDKVFAVNNIDSIGATVYYFNGATDSWLVYNRTQPSVNSAYKIVPIGQAFFIQLKGGNADYTFTLNNSMRVESNDNINFGDSNSSAKKSVGKKELIVYPENSFTLNSTMNNNTDKAYYFWNNNATSEFDVVYDSHKLLSWNSKMPNVYFYSGDVKTALQQENGNETVAVGFKASANEQVEFSLDNPKTFTEVILEDKNEDKYIDLLKNNYTFTSTSNDNERFVLHLTEVTLATDNITAEDVKIYSAESKIYLKLNKETSNLKVDVYNTYGALVYASKLNGSKQKQVVDANLHHGVYVVKFTIGNTIITKSILIN